MPETVEIRGHCDPRFEGVRETFSAAFERGDEVGASVCVVVEGETVVELWAGFADKERTRPWQRDTLVNVYSSTKGITAIAAHRLADRGLLDLDAPVADYWPEFAAAGKEQLPVRYLLSHQAGLAALRKPLAKDAIYDWDAMVGALAAEEPWWQPGAAHGYHALTFGWLVGELIRRLSGQSVGAVVREEIAEPLGAEFHIGCGPELDPRIANLILGPIHAPEDGSGYDLMQAIRDDPQGLIALAYTNPTVIDPESSANSRAWRAAEIPAANGHTNAASLARIYAALAEGGELDGVRLLSREAIDLARSEQCTGEDQVLPLPTRLSLGFFLPTDGEPLGPNPRAFGHGGAGGSLGVADPENRLALGYVMNHMHQGKWLVDPRARALLDAAYADLAAC